MAHAAGVAATRASPMRATFFLLKFEICQYCLTVSGLVIAGFLCKNLPGFDSAFTTTGGTTIVGVAIIIRLRTTLKMCYCNVTIVCE